MAITKRYAHINHAQGDAQNKLDAELAHITGSLYVGQDATLAATLMVTGEISGSSNLRISGSAHMVGAVQMDSTLAVTDKASFGDTTALEAILTAGFGGGPVVADIAVEGIVAIGDVLAVMGDAHVVGSGSISGDLEVDGTLQVHNTSRLEDTVPEAANSFDLGKSDNKWRAIYVQSGSFEHLEAQYLNVAVTASVAQLTGSAGAKFTAGDLKVEAGEVSASMDLKAGGQLVVAGNADLNGTLDVALAADLHGAVIAYSTFNAQGAADLDSTLNVDGAAEFQSTLSASGAAQLGSTLALAGAGTFASSLAVNGAGVALSVANSASIGGDLTVTGNFVVQGEQVILNTVTLEVEDKNIELAKVASPTDITADGAGITIKGATDHTVLWYNDRDGGVDAFSVNDHWLPESDNAFDLGTANYSWRELNLSGDANVGGALDVDGAANLASIDVVGAATFAASIAVAGSGSFSTAVTAQSLSASAGVSGGTLTIAGAADLNGGLDVVGEVSASAGMFAASFDASGEAHVGSLLVDGVASVATLTASVGAEIQGLLSASSMVVEGQATFNGTATFNGDFVVPGTGDFGALVVGGINMSPISASLYTEGAESKTLFAVAIASGEMIKLEMEVIAHGDENTVGSNLADAASFKYSVSAIRTTSGIEIKATEIAKEAFAQGVNLDIDITENGSLPRVHQVCQKQTGQLKLSSVCK